MPLLTVTLNPAIDKLYTVPDFAVGAVYRPVQTHIYAGGKGINVARVIHTLGELVTATGFLGGGNGNYIQHSLQGEGIACDFVRLTAESRVCTMMLDPVRHMETVLNENGPDVTPAECTELLDRLRELLPGHDAVVLSGSVPPGVPLTIYGTITRLAQEEFGVKVVLDASGEALQSGADAQPFLLKPNTDELKALSVDGDGWAGSARELRTKYDVVFAMITGGKRGAVLASEDGLWEAAPPPIDVVSTVGSGDSLTAAFAWAWGQGWDAAESLKLGVAAGAANAMAYGSGFCSREQIFDLASRTIVNKIG